MTNRAARLWLLAVSTSSLSNLALAQEPPPPPGSPQGEPTESQATKLEIPGLQSLRIGGRYRLRYENLIDFDFDDDATDNNDYFGQRVRLDFDLTVNDRLGAFVQVQDARYWGESNSTTSRSSPGLDLHQAYFRVHDMPLTGGDAQLGRQQLSYGDQRLVGSLDWLVQARAFDGARWRWSGSKDDELDVFVTQLSEDKTTKGQHDDAYFFGAYWTSRSDAGAVDLYALGLHDEATDTGGQENRFTLGGRAVRRIEAFELGAELATQVGELDDADIPFGETYGAHAHVRYRFGGSNAPYVQADVDAASGNDSGDGDNQRFDTLFPTAHAHLGMMDFAFWENVVHGALAFGIETSARTQVELSWRVFRAMEATDGVSGPNGVLSSGGAGFSKDLGQEFDLRFRWNLDTAPAKTALEAGYGLFLPGQGTLDSHGSDDPAHFLYAQADLKF